MPDALDVRDDLIDLQRALGAARAALVAYSGQVDAERRELFPGTGDEQIVERRAWPEDQVARL
ncbi:hypothetical protein [Kitasatospora sp. NPDC050543]|uniref:hypothetical protein n=1 Tax=Kitasatospora sp. NPDC050543 TaxID=3364054 RepID=UPI0037A1617C